MLVCAHIEDSDQAAHVRSLIRVFVGRYMGSQRPNVSSGVTLRRRSDCADAQPNWNLHCAHIPTCTLWIPSQPRTIMFVLFQKPFKY